MKDRITKFITSFFCLGYSPFVPGTFGSIGGVIVYFIVKDYQLLYLFTIFFLLIIGMMFSSHAEKIYKRKDAKMIVIDEACGMLISLILLPYRPSIVITGFILFRIFDILKPPPARDIEKVSGSFGIMFDDVIAAIYTNVVLQIIFRLFHL